MSVLSNSMILNAGVGIKDPYWANVVLLAGNDNAVHGTTTFIDQSISARILSRIGTQTINSSAQAPPGMTTSILIADSENSAEGLTSVDSADLDLGAGDFTVEGYIYYLGTGFYGCVASQWQAGAPTNLAWLMLMPRPTVDNNAYPVYTTNGTTVKGPTIPWTPSITNWYHVAKVRYDANLMFFAGGVQVGSTFNIGTDTIFNSTRNLLIGTDSTTGGSDRAGHRGYLGGVRITKGVARYTGPFTPPPMPLPVGQ